MYKLYPLTHLGWPPNSYGKPGSFLGVVDHPSPAAALLAAEVAPELPYIVE
jgi:hypothetical protein